MREFVDVLTDVKIGRSGARSTVVNRSRKPGAVGSVVAAFLVVASGCGSSNDDSTEPSTAVTTTVAVTTPVAATDPVVTSTTEAATTTVVTTTTTVAATTTSTIGSTGEAVLEALSEVAAGAKFDVNWTGPSAQGDYITIVAAGATEWTDEPYFYARAGASPGALVAPVQDGAYALWYVDGATETILARRDIRVTPFEGALAGPEEVEAGTSFETAWNGPDGPGDYVTIVAAGASRWTNESYFYTNAGNPGTLVAPIEPGAYELWYVTAADEATMATRPITVTPYVITLDAPDQVQKGATFEVAWTGPNGPSDYITIVPAGSAEGTYLSYVFTTNGSPVTLTAPTTAGNYEIWYASDRVDGTFGSIRIVVS